MADKLLEVNWGLVLLIALIACAGFAMLYSVAGGHFIPGRRRRSSDFVLGFFILVAAALDRYPGLDEPGLSGLRPGASAAGGGGCGGSCRAWARSAGSCWGRWNCSPPN